MSGIILYRSNAGFQTKDNMGRWKGKTIYILEEKNEYRRASTEKSAESDKLRKDRASTGDTKKLEQSNAKQDNRAKEIQ